MTTLSPALAIPHSACAGIHYPMPPTAQDRFKFLREKGWGVRPVLAAPKPSLLGKPAKGWVPIEEVDVDGMATLTSYEGAKYCPKGDLDFR